MGVWVGSLTSKDDIYLSHPSMVYWGCGNSVLRYNTLSNSNEFDELVEKDMVVTEWINTQIENHVIRGGDELYLNKKIK